MSSEKNTTSTCVKIMALTLPKWTITYSRDGCIIDDTSRRGQEYTQSFDNTGLTTLQVSKSSILAMDKSLRLGHTKFTLTEDPERSKRSSNGHPSMTWRWFPSFPSVRRATICSTFMSEQHVGRRRKQESQSLSVTQLP